MYDGQQLGDPGEVVEGLANIELPLAHGGDPLDDVEEESGTPAGSEHEDDHQEHLDDLLPALVDLLGLVLIALGLLLDEGSLRRCSAHGRASSLLVGNIETSGEGGGGRVQGNLLVMGWTWSEGCSHREGSCLIDGAS